MKRTKEVLGFVTKSNENESESDKESQKQYVEGVTPSTPTYI